MATNPTLITTPFAESGDKTTPPNTNTPSDGRFSQTLGFPPVTAIPLGSGGKAPKREDFNGALNMLANIAFYAQKGFTFNWDSGQAYYVGCRVIDSNDGNMYVCISDVAAGQSRPMNNAAKWKKANMSGGGVSVGTILPYAVNGSLPDDFLECDGGAVSRTLYADLFGAIGTTYGAGDGSTTFNLPNYTGGTFPEGSTTAGTAKSAGLPNIQGGGDKILSAWGATAGLTEGAFQTVSQVENVSLATGRSRWKAKMDASLYNSIYGNSTTVQPKSLTTRFIIKYQ